MKKFKITRWAIAASTMAIITMAVYLFMPLYKVSIFGLSTGLDYIKLLYTIKSYMNLCSFLLPFIGGIGVIATVFIKDRAPHILSLAFALLPLMFFVYVLITTFSFMHASETTMPGVSAFDMIGSGEWTGLLSSLFTLAFTALLVVNDYKELKIKAKK